ncbi:hypothetical protein HGRIS_011232 [Hohenbuehelia grisea]|uniref:C2H2-type domain-containing protein n=1 Tax=Hohenbuehelia grisea TaxID=104357 RepID=A0ABR3JWM0_9AGAR
MCITCEDAWRPSLVEGHLAINKHKIKLTDADEEYIQSLVTTGYLCSDTEEVPSPDNIPEPIEGLAVHSSQFCCRIDGCRSGALSSSAFATPYHEHTLEEQDHVAAKDAVTDGLLQKFFSVGKNIYFEVQVPPPPLLTAADVYFAKIRPTLCKTTVLAPASHDLDRPLLLRTMGWDDHLARWTGDRGSVKRLLSLPVLPRRPKTGIDPYAEVMPLCVSYIMDTGLWIKNTVYASRKALQEWLITHGGLHFSVHGVYKTIEETRFLAQLVVAALRMMSPN